MPILPPSFPAPYDTVQSAMELARVRLNDAIQGIGGNIFTNSAPFSQTVVNGAWRRLQQYLSNLGYTMLTNEIIVSGVPTVDQTINDPAALVWINWSQYFDGVNYYEPPATPVLPQDLIQPLRLWERWTGFNQIFREMRPQLDGIPSAPKTQWNQIWEWRDNAIYMPGSQMVMDLRIRYIRYLPDFFTQGGVEWYNLPMSIMGCRDAMADYIAYEMAKPRGDLNADDFLKRAESEAILIFNREIQLKERTNIRRRPYGRSIRNWW